MTLQDMKERKKELGLSNEAIAKLSGVPFSTVQKIFSGVTAAPRAGTLRALERVLNPERKFQYASLGECVRPGKLQEEAIAYRTAEAEELCRAKQQGEFTLEDYYAIPDERRVELIDGKIYDMAAPAVIHQMILGQLYLQFEQCSSAHEGDCHVFISPCDVQLDRDNRTILQPDLFVICGDFDLKARSIYGAPDLVLEILSDSSRSRDMILKNYKYENAGVREYWIVDPKLRRVIIYNYEEIDSAPEIYSFTAKIPVGISGNSCSIDFGKIYERISRYYED